MPTNTPPGSTSASPAIPQQIGHYQVIAKIGAGGMGEVYRARDTRLNRDVAIKVLPRAFAEDPHRMARFEREAQLLASLNHPKIAAIYGLEESGTTRALVMELVEGPTLAERIGRTASSGRSKAGSASPTLAAAGSGGTTGERTVAAAGGRKAAIPIDEALPIAEQVAEALEYAHEHGVVHRDLKPANIKITPDGDVKILDFGLAKAMGLEEGSGDISNSPTLSLAMTEAGLIIGTAAYMAPEQAKAKQVDRRADIWAFGCVLYEMLSGRKAFEGETVSDILAAVIKSEPDWSALPADTPPAVERLLRRCLQKDVRQRLQAIGDARIAIEETISGEGAAAEAAVSGGRAPGAQRISPLRRALPWALGATTLAAILLAAFAAWLLLQPKQRQNVVRFPVLPPENADFFNGGMPSISPDGRTLAFVAQPGPNKPPVLWLRPLDSLTAQPIPGTDKPFIPFWSPDSQWIGFYADGKLEKVAVSGGAPQALCNDDRIGGATWSRDGVILFAGKDRALYRVPDTGGTPTLVLAPDPAHPGTAYSVPQFLPDGRHFLFLVATPGTRTRILAAGSLDSKTVEHLSQIGSGADYAAPGYLFYLDQSALMARPFDAAALRFTGPAVLVAQGVGGSNNSHGYFSVSPAGALAYMAGIIIQNTPGQIAWFNRAGEKLGTVGKPGIYAAPALSPDGTRFAVMVGEYPKHDIWIYDLKRGAASRLNFNPADEVNPIWTRDGSTVFFSSSRSGQYGIYEKAADGLGSTQPVFLSMGQDAAINDLSPDGRYAIYDTVAGKNGNQIWGVPLFGDRKSFTFVRGDAGQSGFESAAPQFSSNGRYLAYSTNETGVREVYVQTFPQHTGKWQISVSGGAEPIWSRDGKELFYLAPGDNASDTKLMSAAVNTDSAAFQAGIPKPLFQTQLIPVWYWRNIYVPSPDGQRFLMIVPAGQAKQEPITVVMNWPALLKK